MATIGLDKLYYSKITEDASGNETYATPTVLAKAISADVVVTKKQSQVIGEEITI